MFQTTIKELWTSTKVAMEVSLLVNGKQCGSRGVLARNSKESSEASVTIIDQLIWYAESNDPRDVADMLVSVIQRSSDPESLAVLVEERLGSKLGALR